METGTVQPETSAAMNAQPQKEHQWFKKLVGEWTFETDAPAAPGHEPGKHIGTESVRMLGGLWVLLEGQGQMPDGAPATTLMTLGYDPQRKRFVGTWIGSMMTHLWIYDGELDPAEKTLTLSSEGPSMAGDGTMAKYQDIIELKGEDERVLTARVQGSDGTWQQMMTVRYRRRR